MMEDAPNIGKKRGREDDKTESESGRVGRSTFNEVKKYFPADTFSKEFRGKNLFIRTGDGYIYFRGVFNPKERAVMKGLVSSKDGSPVVVAADRSKFGVGTYQIKEDNFQTLINSQQVNLNRIVDVTREAAAAVEAEAAGRGQRSNQKAQKKNAHLATEDGKKFAARSAKAKATKEEYSARGPVYIDQGQEYNPHARPAKIRGAIPRPAQRPVFDQGQSNVYHKYEGEGVYLRGKGDVLTKKYIKEYIEDYQKNELGHVNPGGAQAKAVQLLYEKQSVPAVKGALLAFGVRTSTIQRDKVGKGFKYLFVQKPTKAQRIRLTLNDAANGFLITDNCESWNYGNSDYIHFDLDKISVDTTAEHVHQAKREIEGIKGRKEDAPKSNVFGITW